MNIWLLSEKWDSGNTDLYFLLALLFYVILYFVFQAIGIYPMLSILPLAFFVLYRIFHKIKKDTDAIKTSKKFYKNSHFESRTREV